MMAKIAGGLAALLLLLSLTSSSWAATDADMEFSRDGHTWTAQPPPIFPDVRLVPGGRATSDLWIRHHGPDPARLTITAAPEPAGSDIHRWLATTVDGEPPAPGTTWTGPVTAPGVAVESKFVVGLSLDAPLDTRAQGADVLSHVTFRAVPTSEIGEPPPQDSAIPPQVDPEQSSGPPGAQPPVQPVTLEAGRLAQSGAAVLVFWALAAVLVASGIALHRRRAPSDV